MYQVVRIFYKGKTEQHSIEEKATLREALVRFHSIIATDLNNAEVTYAYCGILKEDGKNAVDPFMFNAASTEFIPAPNPFKYAVLRVRVANGQRSTSVEFKEYQEAIKRYFAILAADLGNDEVTQNMCSIIDGNGYVVEARSFN